MAETGFESVSLPAQAFMTIKEAYKQITGE
jgi:hypothetical protein